MINTLLAYLKTLWGNKPAVTEVPVAQNTTNTLSPAPAVNVVCVVEEVKAPAAAKTPAKKARKPRAKKSKK
jgi:hypothetical protein